MLIVQGHRAETIGREQCAVIPSIDYDALKRTLKLL
jgi:hypothetical protein